MTKEYWRTTVKRYLKDMVGTSLKSPVLEDLLKMAETFEVPETVEV
jgi:hypothetical protein